MPTAARLFAAIVLGATALLASVAYVPLLPEGTRVGMLAPLNTVLGVLVGWRLVGRTAPGQGYGRALTQGFVGAAVLLFWVLLLWASWEMLQLSLRKRFDGVPEALEGVFSAMAEYGVLLLTGPAPGATLLIGGFLSGLVAEWGARRYR